MFYFARCMNIIFNSLLAQLIKYDVHTTRKIKFVLTIFYYIKFSTKNGHCIFKPLWGLSTYAVHLMFIGKLIVDFLLVVIELLSLGVMAEVLRPNIDCKSANSEWVSQCRANFCAVGDIPHKPFLHR